MKNQGRSIVNDSELFCELFYGKNSIEVLKELKEELSFTSNKKCVKIENAGRDY